MIKEYILQNWALVLLLLAFTIMLKTTVFLDKNRINRMLALIIFIFLLSISVFVEFYVVNGEKYLNLRKILMCIRYSATPFIIALVLYALVRRAKWHVFIPASLLLILNIISIFTGIVFDFDENGELVRGFLGYLPFIGVGLYSAVLVYLLIKQSNKQLTEIIPICFLLFAFVSGLIFPFVFGSDYAKIFCTTVAISLFVYYVFLILQLTKKDALTGLFNRQAYYSMIENNYKEITALISIDMNGLKEINDNGGHQAGDTALETLATCFMKASRSKQSVYRIGGDEFMIICRKTTEDELKELVSEIEKYVSETIYHCAVGYSFNDGAKDIDQMTKESDEMMYRVKAEYYTKFQDRRSRDVK